MFSESAERSLDGVVTQMLDVFSSCSGGLRFTHEKPVEKTLQFLDLKLRFLESHICWAYEPRSKKRILPYESAHSKLVKRGIASTCLEMALKRSCEHSVQDSFNLQISRLQKAGFPQGCLTEVAEGLLKKFKGATNRAREKPKTRQVIIPYLHAMSHNLKKVAQRFRVPVVFSAPEKMARLCRRINNPQTDMEQCGTKHKTKYAECAVGVVYEIPLSCGSVYIDQTGRCVNDRAREHASAMRASPSGNLAVHCSRCPCSPVLHDVKVLAKYKDKICREVHEAFEIRAKGDECVSEPSLALSGKEFDFIKRSSGLMG